MERLFITTAMAMPVLLDCLPVSIMLPKKFHTAGRKPASLQPTDMYMLKPTNAPLSYLKTYRPLLLFLQPSPPHVRLVLLSHILAIQLPGKPSRLGVHLLLILTLGAEQFQETEILDLRLSIALALKQQP